MALRPSRLCVALAVGIASYGCSSAGSGGTAAARPATVVRDRNVITEAELQVSDIRDLNVLEVVRRLRPNFLQTRGPQTIRDSVSIAERLDRIESGKVHASFDGISIIGLNELENIFARSITEIRYLNASAAMQKFGPRAYAAPVILVSTK